MHLEDVGIYLGRVVRLVGLRSTSDFPRDFDAADSVLMLWFQHALSGEAERVDLFRRVARALPLAVRVHGPGARSLFGKLVEHLDAERPLLHIMTGLCHGTDAQEAVEEFLSATWPAEGRFDDWHAYSIVDIGEVKFHNDATQLVRALLSRS